MSQWKEPPILVLETKAELEQYLATWTDDLPHGLSRFCVEAKWIESEIDAIEREGQYPYNSVVRKRVELALGWPERSEAEYSREGTPLSVLIYNAQCYRRSNRLRAQGYQALTQSLLDRLGEGARLQTIGGELLTVRKVGGDTPTARMYAFKPNKRTRAVWADGELAVKPVPNGRPWRTGDGRRFASFDEANARAIVVHRKRGIFIAVEYVPFQHPEQPPSQGA